MKLGTVWPGLYGVIAVLTVGVMAAWLLIGAKIAAGLDRLWTVEDAPPHLGRFALDSDRLSIGSRRWWLGSDLPIAQDSHRRATLSTRTRSFTFGPTADGSAASAGHGFDFAADPGDEIAFTRSRSWLAWPTPFQYSVMGATRTSWRRHAYYRLLWKKRTGAAIEMVWRDEQGYYAGVGWIDRNLQVAPIVTIWPSPFEAVIVSYLLRTKGWTRDMYRLENLGASSDGQCDMTRVVHAKDQAATHPGAGLSVDLCIGRKSGQVTQEIGGQ